MTQPALTRPWNSPDWSGALWSALLPLAATLVENGLIFTFGAMKDPNYAAAPLAPPGWVVGAMWNGPLRLWGLARWRAWTPGPAGRPRRGWVTALIVWGLLYPVGALFWTTAVSAVAIRADPGAGRSAAPGRPRGVSRPAAVLLAPSLAWLCFAGHLGWAAVVFSLP
ncbi:MAG: hypothetical protein WDM92_10895 [Caulobacteraceae bacterium]